MTIGDIIVIYLLTGVFLNLAFEIVMVGLTIHGANTFKSIELMTEDLMKLWNTFPRAGISTIFWPVTVVRVCVILLKRR